MAPSHNAPIVGNGWILFGGNISYRISSPSFSYIEGEWFCSAQCQIGSQNKPQSKSADDHLQEYSRALAWEGLLQLCHIDAERENDGPQLLRLWRISVPYFWSGRHHKYLILAHRLLAGNTSKPGVVDPYIWHVDPCIFLSTATMFTKYFFETDSLFVFC